MFLFLYGEGMREREREREKAGKVTLELPFPGLLQTMMNSIQMTCYLTFFLLGIDQNDVVLVKT
jgi:hypothetical protein